MAEDVRQSAQDKKVVAQTKTGSILLDYADIVYVEYRDRCLLFVLNDGTVKQTTTIRTSFTEQVKPLELNTRFVRTHQSFLVNFDYVAGIHESSMLLCDGSVIPISQKRRKDVGVRYTSFIVNMGYTQLGMASEEHVTEAIGAGLCIMREMENGEAFIQYLNQELRDLCLTERVVFPAITREDVFRRVHPDDCARTKLFYYQVLNSDTPLSFQCRLLKNDGDYIHVYINVRCVKNKHFNTFYVLYLPVNSFR
ncbi:MAG: LytTR family transcriptional regulator DNA-binding domain-containing protein [Clostridia bacterium]